MVVERLNRQRRSACTPPSLSHTRPPARPPAHRRPACRPLPLARACVSAHARARPWRSPCAPASTTARQCMPTHACPHEPTAPSRHWVSAIPWHYIGVASLMVAATIWLAAISRIAAASWAAAASVWAHRGLRRPRVSWRIPGLQRVHDGPRRPHMGCDDCDDRMGCSDIIGCGNFQHVGAHAITLRTCARGALCTYTRCGAVHVFTRTPCTYGIHSIR